MKRFARTAIVTLIVATLALPIVYVGGEGPFYLASGESYFPEGTPYRRLYAPLDALGDHYPAVYDARQTLANGWLHLSGDPTRKATVRPWRWRGFILDVF